MMNPTITAVGGIRAGHATIPGGASGCTVLLGPFRGAVDVRGLATGTREIEVLSPGHVAPQVDAVLLTGGSAPGLAAADGVVRWLRARGLGLAAGAVRIPIVPAAVIFDLRTPDQASPDADLGEAACDAATNGPLLDGRIGAGAGATVGKVRGPEYSSRGGLGTYAVAHGHHRIGVLAVVNALGDVVDHDGRIIAGARGEDDKYINSMHALLNVAPNSDQTAGNTTLCVIATDAPLSRTALQTVARMGSSAIVRRIAPANTVFDGDLVFAVSTAVHVEEVDRAELLSFGCAAQLALEEAILRAVRHGRKP
jgi:L-aminopeptidase/D-esterase-like protein